MHFEVSSCSRSPRTSVCRTAPSIRKLRVRPRPSTLLLTPCLLCHITENSSARDVCLAAPRYLDCCNLVRRCVLDLKHEFGFIIGNGHQAYQFDTLPIELGGPEELQPGDLIFWAATYNDPNRKPRRHDMVHVEVFVGGETGEATIGSRSTDPFSFQGVAHHASYRSYAENCTASHDFRLFFRSIDTWLSGVCVSRCKECTWNEPPQNLAALRMQSILGGGSGTRSGKDRRVEDENNGPANDEGRDEECRACEV